MRASSYSQYSEQQLKQAIEWFVCLQSEQCSAEEQLRFETWLAKNDNHRAAYAEAKRVWSNMDDLKFMQIPGLAEARLAKPRKSMATQLSSLAFFILSSTLIGGAWLEYSAETIDYVTRLGEHRHIELADNSIIHISRGVPRTPITPI
jgi:transmembrane sensor